MRRNITDASVSLIAGCASPWWSDCRYIASPPQSLRLTNTSSCLGSHDSILIHILSYSSFLFYCILSSEVFPFSYFSRRFSPSQERVLDHWRLLVHSIQLFVSPSFRHWKGDLINEFLHYHLLTFLFSVAKNPTCLLMMIRLMSDNFIFLQFALSRFKTTCYLKIPL